MQTLKKWLAARFDFPGAKTSLRTETLAGCTTFCTMAYIIFVQPAVLSGAMFGMETGMDFGALTTATCLAAAFATAIMGFYARLPIALAPGMGQNFFFVFSAIPAAAAAGFDAPWSVALGTVFIAGILFLLLSIFGVREAITNTISPSMISAITVGIGLFIAYIGLKNAGVVLPDSATGVKLNTQFASPDLILFFTGLFITAAMRARGIKGAILWGILISTGLALLVRFALQQFPELVANSPTLSESMLMSRFQIADAIVAAPPAVSPTLFKLDLVHALSIQMLPFIAIFLFMDMFDTIGTLIGVGKQAGLMENNRLKNGRQAMLADAAGTIAGASLGTSTVTSYIESASGVEQGGRTGFTAVTVSLLFLAALFFSPIIAMVGSYAVVTAPALVIVGSMMMRNVRHIDWDDYTESLPAFLILLGIPLSFSIGDGIALGFISYPIVKLLAGKGAQAPKPMFFIGAALIAYFVFLRATI